MIRKSTCWTWNFFIYYYNLRINLIMTNHREIIFAFLLSISMVAANTALFNVLKPRKTLTENFHLLIKFLSVVIFFSLKIFVIVILLYIFKHRAGFDFFKFLCATAVFLLIFMGIVGYFRPKNSPF